MTEQPIVVNHAALPTALGAALRYILGILGPFAVAQGWVDAENIDGIVTLLMSAAVVAYGLYKTYKQKKQLVVTANAAPDSVAVVK